MFSGGCRLCPPVLFHKDLGCSCHSFSVRVQGLFHRDAECHKPYGGGHYRECRQPWAQPVVCGKDGDGVQRYSLGCVYGPVHGAVSLHSAFPDILPAASQVCGSEKIAEAERSRQILLPQRELVRQECLLSVHLCGIYLSFSQIRGCAAGGWYYHHEADDAVLILHRRVRIRR